MVIDEQQLRKEIAFAIKNATGIRIGLFTPDQAFAAIVRKQIERLHDPAQDCLCWVSSELSVVINKCTEKKKAALVIISADVDPIELVLHLPSIYHVLIISVSAK